MTAPAMNQQTHPTLAAENTEQPCLVSSHALPLPATFSFDCYGVRFDASIRNSDESGAQLVVSCDLGKVPYSAESKSLRRYLHAVVDAGTGLPSAKITLDQSQAIVLRGTMNFPGAPSPAVTAAGTAAIAISVKSIVEIIEAYRAGTRASRRRFN